MSKTDNNVLTFMEKEIENDIALREFYEKMGALIGFLDDLEYLMAIKGITKEYLYTKVNVTQRAFTFFERMRSNVSYDFLRKVATFAGGKLFITPDGNHTFTVPYDLQEKVDEKIKKTGETLSLYISKLIRKDLN